MTAAWLLVAAMLAPWVGVVALLVVARFRRSGDEVQTTPDRGASTEPWND